MATNIEEEVRVPLSKHHDHIALKQSLGIPSGVGLIVGIMIGSGIFATPKWVLIYSGSVGLCLIVWVLGGLISLLGALCYIELGLMIPKSGGEYHYLMEAFGRLPAFLFAWAAVVARCLGNAILMLIFASYIIEPIFPGCSDRVDLARLQKLLAVAALGVIAIVNCASVEWASRVQIIFTVAKMAAIVLLIFTGIVRLAQGYVTSFKNPFKDTQPKIGMLGFAFYNALFSYEGWNSINAVIEEFKDHKRNAPIAIRLSIILVTASYVLVNIGYLAVLSPEEVIGSNAVAVTLANRLYGVMAWIIPFLVSCSVFGAVNGSFFAGGRVVFAAAREGHLPKLLAMIHTKQRTPIPAIIWNFIITIVFMTPKMATIGSLVTAFGTLVWFNHGITLLSLLWLRYKKRDAHRPYKVFLGFPCLLIVVAVYLVIASFYGAPIGSLIVFAYILTGIPVYFIFVHYKLIPTRYVDKMTLFLQNLLSIAFPKSETGEI